MVVGIHRKAPSSSGGMNSRPSPGNFCAAQDHGPLSRTVSAPMPTRCAAAGITPKTRSKPSHTEPPSRTSSTGATRNAALCSRHQCNSRE